MNKSLTYLLSLVLLSGVVVAGTINVIGALELGKAYQTINLAKLMSNRELAPEVSRALYSEVKVFECAMKLDKENVLLRFTLGSAMNEAEQSLAVLAKETFSREEQELGHEFSCSNA